MFDQSPKTYNAEARRRIGEVVRKVEGSRPPPGRDEEITARDRGPEIRLGKTAGAITKGLSGTVNIYTGKTKGAETWDGTTTVSAYNRFADISSGKWVIVIWNLGGWELIAAEC